METTPASDCEPSSVYQGLSGDYALLGRPGVVTANDHEKYYRPDRVALLGLVAEVAAASDREKCYRLR